MTEHDPPTPDGFDGDYTRICVRHGVRYATHPRGIYNIARYDDVDAENALALTGECPACALEARVEALERTLSECVGGVELREPRDENWLTDPNRDVREDTDG